MLIFLLIVASVVIAFCIVCKVRENTDRLAEERNQENYLVAAGEPDPIV